MKSILLFIAFFCLGACTASYTQKAEHFIIFGNIKGIKPGSEVRLLNGNTKAPIAASTVQQKDGASYFILSGKLPEPDVCLLIIEGSAAPVNIYMENAKVTITGNMSDSKKWKIAGSKSHKAFEAFEDTFTPLSSSLSTLANTINISPAGEKRDSLLVEYNKTNDKIQEELDSFVKKHKKSNVAALALIATMKLYDDPVALNDRFEQLKPSVKSSYLGQILSSMLKDMLVGAVGSLAMDFTQEDTAGNPVAFSAFRGKYVLLDFWASWCRPCRDENPNVVKAYHKFKDRNFDVLGVSLDRPGRKNDWIKAIHIDSLAWTNVSDLKFWENEVAVLYKVRGIPQNFLVNPEGKIIGKNLRGPALEEKLCEILGGCD